MNKKSAVYKLQQTKQILCGSPNSIGVVHTTNFRGSGSNWNSHSREQKNKKKKREKNEKIKMDNTNYSQNEKEQCMTFVERKIINWKTILFLYKQEKKSILHSNQRIIINRILKDLSE